jgi:hypothetical protein
MEVCALQAGKVKRGRGVLPSRTAWHETWHEEPETEAIREEVVLLVR